MDQVHQDHHHHEQRQEVVNIRQIVQVNHTIKAVWTHLKSQATRVYCLKMGRVYPLCVCLNYLVTPFKIFFTLNHFECGKTVNSHLNIKIYIVVIFFTAVKTWPYNKCVLTGPHLILGFEINNTLINFVNIYRIIKWSPFVWITTCFQYYGHLHGSTTISTDRSVSKYRQRSIATGRHCTNVWYDWPSARPQSHPQVYAVPGTSRRHTLRAVPIC